MIERFVKLDKRQNLTSSSPMGKYREPQHFFATTLQNWDLRSSKDGPAQTLYKQLHTNFQNIRLVALGIEGSKFLVKCYLPSWDFTFS